MDALRCFAAVAVVVDHTRQLIWAPPAAGTAWPTWSRLFSFATGFGGEAVMIFFVLSGYWISRTAARRVGGRAFWPQFVSDRLIRLLLVLVPALAVGATLDVLGATLFGGAIYRGELGLIGLTRGVFENLTPGVLVGNLFFLQPFAVAPAGTNGPLWSLGYEFWYYIWYAALAVSIARRRPSPALIFMAMAIVWPALAYLFPVWLIGSVLYHADRHPYRWMDLPRARARILLAVGVAGVMTVYGVSAQYPGRAIVADLLVGVAFAGVLWALLCDAVDFPRWLAPFARYGSGASFSLYVTHYPLLAFSLSALGLDARREPDFMSLLLILLLCAVAIGFGWLFAQFTEAHTARVRSAVRPGQSRPTSA